MLTLFLINLKHAKFDDYIMFKIHINVGSDTTQIIS